MYGPSLTAEDPEFIDGRYSGSKAYARTKRMQVVLAQMWAERLGPDGSRWRACGRAGRTPEASAGTCRTSEPLPFMRSSAQGADTMIWLVATVPSADGSRVGSDTTQAASQKLRARP
jgi:dehydrogenase/reductase SDR family member 12